MKHLSILYMVFVVGVLVCSCEDTSRRPNLGPGVNSNENGNSGHDTSVPNTGNNGFINNGEHDSVGSGPNIGTDNNNGNNGGENDDSQGVVTGGNSDVIVRDTDPEILTNTVCGDGILTRNEACDDKNNESGDGCQADCLAVEEGYSCNPPGRPCQQMSKCGNGTLMPPELCDDGNTDRGDGCNDLCMVEIGFKCKGSPSVCTKTVCGDSKVEGAEGCDDGNAMPFDGCDGRCQVEPSCKAGGDCSSACGDGLLIDEECDDGNNQDGDGCSAGCKEEEGYDCILPETPGLLEVPVIYKDFSSSHPDFEPGATGCTAVTKGMVANRLGNDGKPVAASNVIAGCGTLNNLEDWYDYSGGSKAIIVSTMKLFDNGRGGYVNQWGEKGEQWTAFTDEEWCADRSCNACSCAEACIEPCTWGTNACCATPLYFDGDPFFFPLDGLGITPQNEYDTSNIGPDYGYEAWPDEEEAVNIAGLDLPMGYRYMHNFHFTSEVRFWFQYDDKTNQVLSFVGDDDVWVFIANRLVVDLGGIHTPQEGVVNINKLGLTNGEVYEIVVFQAERQTKGSTYRLTLSGFNTARSECRPKCGDKVIQVGEQCDDGVNDGGYGECAEGCVLGEYCGDGIIQKEYEDCDDGNFFEDDACPASCREIVII